MSSGKRLYARAHTSFPVLIGLALGACSASTSSVPDAQTLDSATRPSEASDSVSLPVIVVTATRLNSTRVAEETSPQPRPKRRS